MATDCPRPTVMYKPGKERPKTVPVITEAYIQNRREDECLFEKLDSMHYQHYANLLRLRQTVSSLVRQKDILLTQRAITPQSSLNHVLDEIYTYKQKKRATCTKSHLPVSTEVYVSRPDSKWPSPLSQSLPSAPPNVYRHMGATSLPRVRSLDETTLETTSKPQQILENPERRPRATSSLQRRSQSSMESLTYKELSGIARLQNISMREAERRKQQVQLERQKISRLSDTTLQDRVHRFLKKLE